MGRYKPTGMPNGRPPAAKSVIRKAISDRNLEDLLWAYIYEHNNALNAGQTPIFDTRHIVSFIQELSKIRAEKGEDLNKEDLTAFFDDKRKKIKVS